MSLFWTAPIWTWPLLLVLAVGAVLLTFRIYGQTWPQPAGRLRHVLIGLRIAALVLLVLAVAGPVMSRLRENADRATLVIVVEDSASMAITDGVGGADTSRWRRALDLAGGIPGDLENRDLRPAVLVLRGNGIEPVHEFAPGDPQTGEPVAQGTDLNGLAVQAREVAVDRAVRAIVVLGDGQETVGSGGARRGEPGADLAPVLAVGVGDPRGPADRIVKDLRYPGTAYRGDEVVVEVSVDHRFADRDSLPPIRAVLYGPNGVVADTTVPVTTDLVPLELVFRPEHVGPQAYRLEVSPLDNERFLANNEVSLAVDVRRQRSSLLLLCERPGWDVRFLAGSASREPRLSLTVVYATPTGLVHADSMTAWTNPEDVAGWRRWDGVVLIGWEGRLASLDWDLLQDAVDAGLGLLVLPEENAVQGPPAGLRPLLPVVPAAEGWISGAYTLRSDPTAWSHAILGDGGDPTPGTGRPAPGWADLPPLRELYAAAPEIGASLLLRARGRSGPGQRLVEIPVLATLGRGAGRVAWFGGRNLWELAFYEPEFPAGDGSDAAEQPARRMLRNLLIWTAEGQQSRELTFTGRRPSYLEGERIRLGAQWRDLRGQPVTGRRISLVLRRAEQEDKAQAEITYPLTELGDRSGRAQVMLPPLPPGAYTIQLVGQGDSPTLSRRETLVVTRHSIEATQVRQDPRRLAQLASRTGGAYVDGHDPAARDEIAGWLAGLDWSARNRSERSRLDLLTGWPFLVLMTVVLGVEWFLRRRHGML